ncbi:MAG: hypothetical protein M3174_03260 [Actinomycetota bacterium]|nr:hypothetical protein [Actinomycetota bacterium]
MPDPDLAGPDKLRVHNLEITLENEEAAKRTIKLLEERDLDADVTLDLAEDTRSVLRAEMREEVEATVAGPGNVGPFTKAMMKGIVVWVTLATLGAAGLMALLSLILWPEGVVTMAVIGAVGGSTVGFVVGGFVWPRRKREGQDLAAETGTVVGVHADDAQAIDEAEAIVRKSDGVVRVDRVAATGRPITRPDDDAGRPLRGDVPTGQG